MQSHATYKTLPHLHVCIHFLASDICKTVYIQCVCVLSTTYVYVCNVVQGVSYWNVTKWITLRGRKISGTLMHGFRRFGYLIFINQFSKKLHMYVGFLLICYISIWDTLYIVYWWVTNSSSWYSSHIVLHQHGKYNRLKTFLKKQTFLFLWACVFTINLFDFQLWNISWKSKSIKIEMLLQKISTFCLAHARLAF